MRKFAAVVFLVLIASLGAAMAMQANRPDPLPVGGALPDVSYRDGRQAHAVGERGRAAVVMLFHSRCGHCHAQLDAMERAALRGDATTYLLTSEDSVATGMIARRWPHLAASPHVRWGSVDAHEFQARFGTLVTPAVFVFDAHHKLVRKYRGEVRTDLLAAAPTRI